MRASQLKMINCPSQYSLRNISKRWSSSTFPRGIFSLDMLTCSSSKHTVHCQGIPTFPAYQQQNLQNHCSCLYWLYYVTGPLQFFGWMKIMHLQAVSWNWHMSPSRAIYAINALMAVLLEPGDPSVQISQATCSLCPWYSCCDFVSIF